MNHFILSCESTIDMPYSYAVRRNLPVLFYTYAVDGQEYEDDMGRDPEALPRFYSFLDAGKLPSTSQINEARYEDFFRDLLSRGDNDILHIAFGSGMTPSVRNAQSAAETLMEEFPDRRILVIDSFCSSSGYGLLVDQAADLRDAGKSMEEIADWTVSHAKTVHHQFYSTDLKFFRRSGRVSGPAAALGSIMGICPTMRLNNEGRIIAYGKAHGRKKAIREVLTQMEKHAVDGRNYSGKCFISHSNDMEDAIATRDAIAAAFPNIAGEIPIYDIGTIIAAHSGPGTLAVFFMGDEREM